MVIPSTSGGHRAAFARSLAAALIGISFAMPLSLAARACSVCDGRFSHRSGSFSVHLATAKLRYRIGEPIPVRVSITNHSRNSLALDTSAPVSELALHIASPHTNFVQFDKARLPRRGGRLPPGGSIRFPMRPLQDWGYRFAAPGIYRISMAYGGVDSNVVTFVIEPAKRS